MSKKLTRRQFLKRSAAASASVALAPQMQWMPGTNVSYAAGPASATDPILVFVQLFGGNDGLNTVYPLNGTQRTTYETMRPTLKNPATVGELAPFQNAGFDVQSVLDIGTDGNGDNYAFHPAMKSWHTIAQAGDLAVLPGVHYTSPSYSHFYSERVYYSGSPEQGGGPGWMGKAFDALGFLPTDVPGVMLDNSIVPLFTPTQTSLLAFNRLNALTFPAAGYGTSEKDLKKSTFNALYAESAARGASFPELVTVGNTGSATVNKIETYYKQGNSLDPSDVDDDQGDVEKLFLDPATGRYNRWNPLAYNSPMNVANNSTLEDMRLARDLRHVAATIRTKSAGARVFHVGIGGFDSHSSQESGFYHSYLLQEVAESVAAFYNEIKTPITLPAWADPLDYEVGDLSNRVVIVTMSEFGRTNYQNAPGANSAGTDHAASAVQFVMGAPVAGGIYGAYPDLALGGETEDDLRKQYDFRDFYGTLLECWMGISPTDIGPGPGKIFPASTVPDYAGETYTAYNRIAGLIP